MTKYIKWTYFPGRGQSQVIPCINNNIFQSKGKWNGVCYTLPDLTTSLFLERFPQASKQASISRWSSEVKEATYRTKDILWLSFS